MPNPGTTAKTFFSQVVEKDPSYAAEDLGATGAGRLTPGLSATKSAWRRHGTRVERCLRKDSFSVREDLRLFVVADGMGGHAAGEVASRAAVEGIVAFIESTQTISPDQTWPIPFDPEESLNTNRLRAGFRMGNWRIAAQIASSSERRGMATTAVAMLIDGETGTLAHVGDSRA